MKRLLMAKICHEMDGQESQNFACMYATKKLLKTCLKPKLLH